MTMQINEVARLETIGAIGVLEINAPPVNALGQRVRQALEEGLRQALADDGVKAIVILCGGRTFFAGADISEFGKPVAAPDLRALLGAIESSPKLVVAAMHGTALGGGFELALACHYRIAAASSQVGLPEVSLGLLPGAGGTQRAPRLMGVAAALDFIILGKPMHAKAAHACGLVDALAEADLRAEAIRFAQTLVANQAPLKRVRDLPTDVSGAGAAAVIAAFQRKNASLFSGFKAPAAIAMAVEAAANLPFEQGLEREWALFLELLSSAESAAQRHLFFAERAASKIPGLSRDVRATPIETVAIIGAGTMGTGIATAFLNADYPVTLIDLSPEALARAAATIAKTLRAAAEKGRITPQAAEARIAGLSTARELSAAGQSDLIVEAVFENLDLKKSIFAQIDAIAKSGAVLASNTSFLDLNAIAAATSRPEHVVGLHFFAPANIMRLLEVVRGRKTSDAVLAAAMELGKKLGKVAILSGVCDGFIANRLMARRGEAADEILLRGPMPAEIDEALVRFGFPMGHFAMMDLVGLDVVGWDRENSAGRTIQEVLCEAGRWGQKKGGGYYDYDDKRRALPSPMVENVIEGFRAANSAVRKSFAYEELIADLLYPVVNEGAKLLEEGIALRASDIDMALVAGYAWPTFSGGPMFWGDTIGLGEIHAHLKARRDAGADIVISPLLARLGSTGGKFAAA